MSDTGKKHPALIIDADRLARLQKWAAIAPHLYIWDYVVNFSHYIMPYPNFRVLQPNIKTFRDNKAIGIMEQAAYQSRGGEFSELKAYLISKQSRFKNAPDTDVDAKITDERKRHMQGIELDNRQQKSRDARDDRTDGRHIIE